MALDYKKSFDYLQNVLNLENIEYEDDRTAVLSSNEWPISGKVYANVRNRGGAELILRYSGMASACIISLDNSEKENVKNVVEYILTIARYNSEDEKILSWPYNCQVGYVRAIIGELEGSFEDNTAEQQKQNEVKSSKKAIKSGFVIEGYLGDLDKYAYWNDDYKEWEDNWEDATIYETKGEAEENSNQNSDVYYDDSWTDLSVKEM